MGDSPQRQHYRLATGQGLDKPAKGPNPGYSKGGKARMGYKGGGASRMGYRKGGSARGC